MRGWGKGEKIEKSLYYSRFRSHGKRMATLGVCSRDRRVKTQPENLINKLNHFCCFVVVVVFSARRLVLSKTAKFWILKIIVIFFYQRKSSFTTRTHAHTHSSVKLEMINVSDWPMIDESSPLSPRSLMNEMWIFSERTVFPCSLDLVGLIMIVS